MASSAAHFLRPYIVVYELVHMQARLQYDIQCVDNSTTSGCVLYKYYTRAYFFTNVAYIYTFSCCILYVYIADVVSSMCVYEYIPHKARMEIA